jgi:hypothetical protein
VLEFRASPAARCQRPFVSVVTGNASGSFSSGVTQSDRAVHGDVNLAQILRQVCVSADAARSRLASARFLHRSSWQRPWFDRPQIKAQQARECQPPEWQPRRSTRQSPEWSAESPRKSNRRSFRYTCHH